MSQARLPAAGRRPSRSRYVTGWSLRLATLEFCPVRMSLGNRAERPGPYGRSPEMAVRSVISTLNTDGTEVMGPGILMYHYPGSDIMNGSLLTVESNHFCVLKSRGAILNVYETGQYPVETPQRPLLGNFQQAFYGGQSPVAVRGAVRHPGQERGQGPGRGAVARAGRAGLRRGLLRARRHQGGRGQAGHAHAVPGARADHRRAELLRRPGRRAVHQPARPGHPAGAGQRADPRHHRAGPRAPAGLPGRLRRSAQRRQGADRGPATSGCAS